MQFPVALIAILGIMKTENTHKEHIKKLFKHINDQAFLKLVLNKH